MEKSTNSDRNIMAVLSYLGILVVIPYVKAKDDEYVKFHVKQGLVLLILLVAVMVVGQLPGIGPMISSFGSILVLILSVIGILNAMAGKKEELPLIGKYSEKIKI